MSTAFLRGIDLAYDQAGSGPTVLLLHGYPFDRSMWCAQTDFLSNDGFRAVAPDLRGLGETKATADITTMDAMARDAAALMDKLEIGRAAICGLSMGAYVALEFVHLFPSRVQVLILAGARAEGPDDAEKESREQQAERVLAEGMGHVADSMLPKLLAPKTLAEKADVVTRAREMILRTNPQGAAAAQRGMAARRDYSNDLEDIDAPTLIIAGHEDGIRKPEDAEFILHGIRDSHLEMIDDAGHLMNIEQPKVFNRAILDFLGVC